MTACPPDFPLGVYETLQTVQKVLADAGLDYCVGGAVAMYTQGYVRSTSDVDFFVDGDDQDDILAVIKRSGLRYREIADSQYELRLPKYAGTDIHADLLFAWSEPELSAIVNPMTKPIGGLQVPVMPMDLLVISKITAADVFKSRQDIGALYQRKLFDPAKVLRKMRSLDVPYEEEFNEVMEGILKAVRNPRPYRK